MNALIFAHTLQQRWRALAQTAITDEPATTRHPKGRIKASSPNDAIPNHTPSNDAPSIDTPSIDAPSIDTPSIDAIPNHTPSIDTPSIDAPSNDASPRSGRPSTAIRHFAETERAHAD